MNFKFLNKLSDKFNILRIISYYKNKEYYSFKYFNKPNNIRSKSNKHYPIEYK